MEDGERSPHASMPSKSPRQKHPEFKSDANDVQSPPRTPTRAVAYQALRADSKEEDNKLEAFVGSKESQVSIWRSNAFFDLSNDPAAGIVGREELNTPGAFVLHNILSRKLCEDIVRQTESMGYEAAKVTTTAGDMRMMKEYRNSSRLLWDLEKEHIQGLCNSILPHVPPTRLGGDVYIPTGINTRLRFLRYVPGEYFKKHFDGGYRGSLMTLIIYLSDNCTGGETHFYRGRTLVDSVVPRAGSALLFYHDHHPLSPMHAGCTVRQGVKHCVRTDIFFNPQD